MLWYAERVGLLLSFEYVWIGSACVLERKISEHVAIPLQALVLSNHPCFPFLSFVYHGLEMLMGMGRHGLAL
jgi:hypothetical protein